MSTETRDFIFAALKRYAPISSPHLAQKLGMIPATVGWQIEKLHSERRVYVHGFSDKRGKTHTRIWAVGDAPDAKRPEKFDRNEYYFGTAYDDEAETKQLAQAEKKGASQEQLEAMWEAADRKRREAIARQIVPFRDPLLFITAGRAA